MAHVLSIANQKGGVGKTTTAVNLAVGLARLGRKVLLIDLDPQGNASTGCGLDKQSLAATVYNVLVENRPVQECLVHAECGVDVLPSNRAVSAAELDLIEKKHSRKRLARALEGEQASYDYILIDTAPSLSMLTVNAFAASNGVVIPMQCEYYALEGLSDLVGIIRRIRSEVNPGIEITGLLRVMFDARIGLQQQVSDQLIRHFGARVFKTVIPRNVRLAEAPSHGEPGLVYDASAKGSKAYQAFAEEIDQRLSRETA